MEETDKGWMMIRISEWVNVSSGTGSPGYRTKGHKTNVVVIVVALLKFRMKPFW